MILNQKTLEKLRVLINEETAYRSGPELIKFFNEIGFRDSYGQGFPSRWKYTDEKLSRINGTPEIDKCIKLLFSPINFIGRYSELDAFIKDFNNYLAYDEWKVVREGKEIKFVKINEIDFEDPKETKEEYFLQKEFSEVPLDKLGLEGNLTDILQLRFEEIKKCFSIDAPLSVIFLSGSTLEGILLGLANKYPKEFNQAVSSPKESDGSVKKFHLWTLSNLIDTACEIGFLNEDITRFSHNLRYFRNYIHPFQQMSTMFKPDKHTAKICWQVLKAAIHQITKT